jgi:hypothetical protein
MGIETYMMAVLARAFGGGCRWSLKLSVQYREISVDSGVAECV